MVGDRIYSCCSQHTAQRLVWGVVVLAAGTAAALALGRAQVPSDKDQAKAQQLLREVYGKEYEEAETPDQKTALARKMLDQAANTKDAPASHFVLLQAGKGMAVAAGDVETAFEAVGRIAATYDVDALEMKAETFRDVAGAARTTSQFKTIAEQTLALIDEAAASDDYTKAGEFGELGLALARRARDYALAKQIAQRNKELEELAAAYAEVQAARKALENNPTDPEANLVVGRYLCFVAGEWEKGISMLALGSDAELKAQAVKELEGARSAEEEVAVGDGWWELAQAEQDAVRKAMMLRAGSWYRSAQARVSGLVKVKIDSRLEEIGVEEIPALPRRVDQPVFKFDDESLTAQYWLWNGEWDMGDDGGKAPNSPGSFLRTRHAYQGDLSVDMDFSFGRARFSNTGGCWITIWGKKLVISNHWRGLAAQIHIHREGDQIVFVHNGQEERIPVEPDVWSKPTVIEIRWRSRTSHFRRIEIKAETAVAPD